MPTAPAPVTDKTLLIEGFPAALRQRVKVLAASEGVTQRHWVIDRLSMAADLAERGQALRVANAAKMKARAKV